MRAQSIERFHRAFAPAGLRHAPESYKEPVVVLFRTGAATQTAA